MSPTPTDPNQAQAWITGDPPDQTIDFYIPRGNTGPMGPQGPIGPSVAVGDVVTNMGPAAPGTIGPQGLTGPKGDPGGIVLGTALGTTDLNAIITAGTYYQNDAASGTLARNYPKDTIAGNLVVFQAGPNNLFKQIFYPINGAFQGRLFYVRQYNTNAWTSWTPYGSQRVDQTAGRAVYIWDDVNSRDQLIWGDTGARIISDVVDSANWAAGYTVKLRRVGSQVELRLLGIQAVTGKSGSLSLFTSGYTLPPGFQNQHSFAFPIVDNTGAIANGNMSYGGGPMTIVASAGRSYGILLTWQTLNSWPTALPGTADSAPIAT